MKRFLGTLLIVMFSLGSFSALASGGDDNPEPAPEPEVVSTNKNS